MVAPLRITSLIRAGDAHAVLGGHPHLGLADSGADEQQIAELCSGHLCDVPHKALRQTVDAGSCSRCRDRASGRSICKPKYANLRTEIPIETPPGREEADGWSGGATGAPPQHKSGVDRARTHYQHSGATIVHRRRNRARPRRGYARACGVGRIHRAFVVGRPRIRSVHRRQRVGDGRGRTCKRRADRAGS
jgi:hypothetical protein